MAVFEHHETCPAFHERGAACTCEKFRYLHVFYIGLPLVILEHGSGYLAGSEALHADAWHLVGDLLHDLLAFGILTWIGLRPNREHALRGWGGYLQAALLAASAIAIMYHLHMGTDPRANGWVMTGVGSVAALGNWWRYRILHPRGNPFRLLVRIGRSLQTGSREATTYIGEVFHVLTDVGMSVLAAAGGVLVITLGESRVDEWTAYTIAACLLSGAFVVTVFARRHHR